MTVEQGLRAEFHERPKVLARALRAAREQGILGDKYCGFDVDSIFNWGKTKEGFYYWHAVYGILMNPDAFLPDGYVDVENVSLTNEGNNNDRVDSIDEIRSEKQQSPWTMVEDGLPKHENNVLAVWNGKVCVMAYFSFKDGGETFKVWGYVYDGLHREAIYDDDYKPTKWMDIPTP